MADVIHGKGEKEEGGEILQLCAVETPPQFCPGALAPPGREQRSGVSMQGWGKGDFKVSPDSALGKSEFPTGSSLFGFVGPPG